MTEFNRKVNYFFNTYKLDKLYKCAKCGHYVFRSNTKGYEFRCLYCNKLLFNNQVIKSEEQSVPDTEIMKQDVVNFLKNK